MKESENQLLFLFYLFLAFFYKWINFIFDFELLSDHFLWHFLSNFMFLCLFLDVKMFYKIKKESQKSRHARRNLRNQSECPSLTNRVAALGFLVRVWWQLRTGGYLGRCCFDPAVHCWRAASKSRWSANSLSHPRTPVGTVCSLSHRLSGSRTMRSIVTNIPLRENLKN